jgi:hypothetical protein
MEESCQKTSWQIHAYCQLNSTRQP